MGKRSLPRLRAWAPFTGKRPSERYASYPAIAIYGAALIAVGIGLVVSVVDLWPAVERGKTASSKPLNVDLFFGLIGVKATLSVALILLVLLAGALGGFVHTATSFVTYVGNRTFKSSWVWWYALRLLIGSTLALLLYFAFRGGMLTAQADSGEVNPYGIAALAGLAGLFSKQATDKLKELFDTLFRTAQGEGDARRSDKPDEASNATRGDEGGKTTPTATPP